MHWRQQLESILSEGIPEAREREGNAFDVAAGKYADSIIIYGAGNLGKRILQGLRAHGTEPVAFADANPQLWGTLVDGLQVFSPESAVAQFGHSAVFAVCIWHPVRVGGVESVINHLRVLGAERVVPFPLLFWKYPDTWLPYYFWDLPSKLINQRKAIQEAAAAFGDDASRDAFVRHITARVFGDFLCLPPPDQEPTYFPHDLFTLVPDECFVDCGAFDGDTIREFLHQSRGKFRRVVAFEPDPQSRDALSDTVLRENVRDRTTIYPYVLGAEAGKARFEASGMLVSAVCDDGGIEIERVRLDDYIRHDAPTYIKMDIEGSEIPALQGGRHTIREHRPVLAVSVYHRPDDLWRIPLLIRELEPDCALALRMYWMDGFDVVCYAVPPNRQPIARTLSMQP